MDPIAHAAPLRAHRPPRDDTSAEPGPAGSLALFLCTLDGPEDSDTVGGTPDTGLQVLAGFVRGATAEGGAAPRWDRAGQSSSDLVAADGQAPKSEDDELLTPEIAVASGGSMLKIAAKEAGATSKAGQTSPSMEEVGDAWATSVALEDVRTGTPPVAEGRDERTAVVDRVPEPVSRDLGRDGRPLDASAVAFPAVREDGATVGTDPGSSQTMALSATRPRQSDLTASARAATTASPLLQTAPVPASAEVPNQSPDVAAPFAVHVRAAISEPDMRPANPPFPEPTANTGPADKPGASSAPGTFGHQLKPWAGSGLTHEVAAAVPSPEAGGTGAVRVAGRETSDISRDTPPQIETAAQTQTGPRAGPERAGPRIVTSPSGEASETAADSESRSGSATGIGKPPAAGVEQAVSPGQTAPAVAATSPPVRDLSDPAPSDGAFGELMADLAALATQDAALGRRQADRAVPTGPGAAHLPPGLGHRLAEAITQFPDGAVELTLSPEELGRVRISMSTQDGTLTLTVQADRPDTIDLLRRHIDQLAQDFRDLGLSNLAFSFGHGQDRPPDTQREATDAPAEHDAAPASVPGRAGSAGISPRQGDSGGLDLRL